MRHKKTVACIANYLLIFDDQHKVFLRELAYELSLTETLNDFEATLNKYQHHPIDFKQLRVSLGGLFSLSLAEYALIVFPKEFTLETCERFWFRYHDLYKENPKDIFSDETKPATPFKYGHHGFAFTHKVDSYTASFLFESYTDDPIELKTERSKQVFRFLIGVELWQNEEKQRQLDTPNRSNFKPGWYIKQLYRTYNQNRQTTKKHSMHNSTQKKGKHVKFQQLMPYPELPKLLPWESFSDAKKRQSKQTHPHSGLETSSRIKALSNQPPFKKKQNPSVPC